jgi:hypothetical protein
MNLNLDAKTRKYLYNVAKALVPLLITLGVLNQNVAGQILGVVAAVLSYAVPDLASKNVNEEE